MILILCIFLIGSIRVHCGILQPKDTSYGYVPRDNSIVQFTKSEELWSSDVNSDDKVNSNNDAIIVNSPNIHENINDNNISNMFSDSGLNKAGNRTPKFSQYPSTLYYYEPPPQQYLPPAEPYPEYSTSKPTDEEFFNRPPGDVPVENGYNYDIPLNGLLPPFSHDEPYPAPLSPQYIPVAPDPPNGLYDAPYYTRTTNSKNLGDTAEDGFPRTRLPPHIDVTDMHCYDTPTDGKFQSTIIVRNANENVPVFEDIFPSDSGACVVKTDFSPQRSSVRFQINIPKKRFSECAVKDCSVTRDVVHLCVRLRFPILARMKLADDPILTLQCRTQDRIAAHTKHLAVNIDNSVSQRSSEIAKGGTRGGLRSHVSLFRKGARGDHSEPLPRGARVPLGEMLMLKALIEPQDGWFASRMSTVSMSGSNGANMQLLGADGCRDQRARALCPRDAKSIGPLGHTLYIRAAMFEGMRSGEEVRLSVRMVACLDPADCKQPRCLHGSLARNRRETMNNGKSDATNQTIDSTSVLSFKVVLPNELEILDDNNIEADKYYNQTPIIVMMIVLCATIICSSILIFIKKQFY